MVSQLDNEMAKSARTKKLRSAISLVATASGAILAIAGAIIVAFLGFTYDSHTSWGSWTAYYYRISGTTTLLPVGLTTLIIGILLLIGGIAIMVTMLRGGELNVTLRKKVLGSVIKMGISFGVILFSLGAFTIYLFGFTYKIYPSSGWPDFTIIKETTGTSALFPFGLVALIIGIMLILSGIVGGILYIKRSIRLQRKEQDATL